MKYFAISDQKELFYVALCVTPNNYNNNSTFQLPPLTLGNDLSSDKIFVGDDEKYSRWGIRMVEMVTEIFHGVFIGREIWGLFIL